MNTTIKSRSVLENTGKVLWAVALICLPVTTFPLFSSLTGALVAPLSILPFFLLLLIWSLPMLVRKQPLPRESVPLAVFVLAAILSCAAAYFIFIPGFKGKSVPGQEMRAIITLAIGITFYLVTVTWVRNIEQLHKSWKYISIGGILSLLWTGVQAFYILQHVEQYPAWLDQFQSWWVVESPAFTARFGRVNGLTYEASWFAHQMVLIYLPLWMAATYHRTSGFKFRMLGISIENILLILGVGAFLLSSPRIGLLSFILILIAIFIKLNVVIHRKIVGHLVKRGFGFKSFSKGQYKIAIQVSSSILIVFVYVLLITSAFFLFIQRDYRLAILLNEPPSITEVIGLLTLDQNVLIGMSSRFLFLERVIYWLNGWNVFNQYPFLGVGLGNSGFFFPVLAPAIGWATFEIRSVLFYLPQLPNVKSLWFRLFAETGLIGFSVFVSWIVLLIRSSGFAQQSQDGQDGAIKTFALAGQLAMLAFIGEGFSIDSFAMPYFWVAAGLLAATSMIVRSNLKPGLRAYETNA